ncbi:MAG: shikimate kinase [Clostridiales bacterium]|nr:shikimate kinase [Clostridiales bacterium]
MKTYGLLGESLSHSFSPQIHASLGFYRYLLFEKKTEELESFLNHGSFNGINVTIPYKKTVMPFCTALSDIARRIGSVNTIIKQRDGVLFGDNTDYFGFHHMLKKSGIAVAGKKVVILGNGGTSLTVREVLRAQGAENIVVISRSGPDNFDNIQKHHDADVIINTTPVGMYPNNGKSLLALRDFSKCSGVLDVIFNPLRTKLLLDAEEMGISCMNGLTMLVAQAKKASELFTGNCLNDDIIDNIVNDIGQKMQNIALIGMPGCGKSKTGLALASLLNRRFVDIDDRITTKAQKSIESIFRDDGELFFRNLEHQILADVSKQNGLVIATGGGVVTRKENRELLRQNSLVVFLDRPLAELSSEGRPLSQTIGAEKLADERLPLYRKWCDFQVACSTERETAMQIKSILGI